MINYNKPVEEYDEDECRKPASLNWEDLYNSAASDVKRLECENDELKIALRVMAKLL